MKKPRKAITPSIPPDVNVIGYRRVSKEEQASDWRTSLSDQTRAILLLAAKLTLSLLEEHIFEDLFSGGTAEDREGFMRLVRHCQQYPRPRSAPGYVLVLNDSRFGRFDDPEEAAYWRVVLQKSGWRVQYAENDDVADPATRGIMRAVAGAEASRYRANIRENAKRGARGAAERGLWQNEAPFGYRRLAMSHAHAPIVLDIGRRKADDQWVQLTPGPEDERRIVTFVFEAYAGGLHSLGGLAQMLRQMWPHRKWSKQTVRAMLINPAYQGDVVWCRRPHDKRERQETPVRDESAWVVTLDAHPALVTRELFARVQERLATNKKQTRATAGGYVLSGMIRCAHCGSKFIGGGGRVNPDPDGDPDWFRFYKDSGADKEVCPGKMTTLLKRWVEPTIVREIGKMVGHPTVQQMIAHEFDRLLSELNDPADAEGKNLQKERTKLEAKKDRLVRAVAEGAISTEDVASEMRRVRAELDRIRARLSQLHRGPSAPDALMAERDRLLELAADFGARAEELSGPALRELIRPWISDAIVDKHRRILTLVLRRIPESPRLLLSTGPAPDSR